MHPSRASGTTCGYRPAQLFGFPAWLFVVLAATWILGGTSWAQPHLRGASAPAGSSFRFQLSGEAHASYVVQASTNMVDWVSIKTNYSAEAERLVEFPVQESRSFYRTLRLPELLFAQALTTVEGIELNGNSITVDSFDSAHPSWSTGGQYDPLKRRDRGSLRARSGTVNVANARVMGRVITAPEGRVLVGPNGSIGSVAWVNISRGIEPGWSSTGTVLYLPKVVVPFTNAPPPAASPVAKYSLSNESCQLPELILGSGERMLVSGSSALHVTDALSLSNDGHIVIAPGATLRLFVSAPSAVLGGSGIVNQAGNATNFQYYGSTNNTAVSLGPTPLLGVIYAPGADFRFTGSGSNQFIGAIVARSASITGNQQIHYDECLGRLGPRH